MESNIIKSEAYGGKVFVNGTFDVLHLGHLKLLNYARSKASMLVVAIDTDNRVKSKKGPSRPVNTYEDRKEFLLELGIVDHVVSFETDDDLRNAIKDYQPDLMIVGSDWRSGNVLGSEHARKLEFYNRIEPYSTSRIVDR